MRGESLKLLNFDHFWVVFNLFFKSKTVVSNPLASVKFKFFDQPPFPDSHCALRRIKFDRNPSNSYYVGIWILISFLSHSSPSTLDLQLQNELANLPEYQRLQRKTLRKIRRQEPLRIRLRFTHPTLEPRAELSRSFLIYDSDSNPPAKCSSKNRPEHPLDPFNQYSNFHVAMRWS